MRTSTQTLPGILEIRYISTALLSDALEERSLAGIPLAILDPSTQVEHIGDATMVVVAEFDNNAVQQKVELEFRTNEKVPQWGIALLVRAVNGEWYIIGTLEVEPVISIDFTTGIPSGEASVYTVKVVHSGRKALIPVAV